MYKYCICFFLLLTCAVNLVYAQNNGVVIGGKWADQVSITDVNGRPFESKYTDVSGTPYFTDQYKIAAIQLKEGKRFPNVRTRIDILSQEMHFLSSNGVEGYISAGMVKEISYADTIPTGIIFYKFQTGFPAADKQTENNFYQVLAEGKCGLLKSISKSISERKNELSGEVVKEFETTENYYLFAKGNMKRIKKDKDFFIAELSDKQNQIVQFIQSNKLNFKNNDHIVKLMNYYNSL